MDEENGMNDVVYRDGGDREVIISNSSIIRLFPFPLRAFQEQTADRPNIPPSS